MSRSAVRRTSASPRHAALRLIEGALAHRGGLEEALGQAGLLALEPRDRAFARAVAMAALRHLGPIDRLLDKRLQREPPEPVRNILRLGLAQAFWLDSPDYAVVDSTVEMAPERLRGLVNAVMRRTLAEGRPSEAAADLAPPWLLARWRSAFGEAAADAIAAQIVIEPATDLTRRDANDLALAGELEGEALDGGSIRISRRGDVAEWTGYAEGRWWVQDAAAAIPARLLLVKPGETALDMCAAPGGKTLQLAASGATVTALDRSERRMRRIASGLQRTGLNAETIAVDARTWAEERSFDAVLLDAPCTSTGAFRRHPDVLWNVRPGDVAALATEQKSLLDAAATRVRPGGRLVYSVCSLETEEGEAQITQFLASHPDFHLQAVQAGEGGAPEPSCRPEGWLRILPGDLPSGIDGFFIARMVRSA